MTLQDAINYCYLTISDNEQEVITTKLVISKNSLIAEDVESLNQTIAAALLELESLKVLVKIADNKWILRKKLSEYTQTIEITHDFSSILVQQLNLFLERTGKEDSKATIGNLNNQDLVSIFLALKTLNGLCEAAQETDAGEE